ncbi:MAG: hypothetical protein CK533_01130 [Acidobacterium sp.]|nr:hypothetical protein [Acidobacteriota bacterium]PHY11916.1 MAG: hypothetical protein CK533_01130 [Acidobacterium sp.]
MNDEPKSALELAMARLKKQDADAGVIEHPLTNDQKNEIGEIRKTYAAKLAQEEILYQSKLAGSVDFEQRQTMDEHYRRDVERLNHERDRKVEKIRNA